MTKGPFILAIDQGTTSSRAIIFDGEMRVKAIAQEEFTQHFPKSGWVEHDPSDIWSSVASTCRGAIEKAGISAADVAAIGITDQRETVVVWDKTTGAPLHRAIVWQDRRTAERCDALAEAGHRKAVFGRALVELDKDFRHRGAAKTHCDGDSDARPSAVWRRQDTEAHQTRRAGYLPFSSPGPCTAVAP